MGKREMRWTGAVLALSLVTVSCSGGGGARVANSGGDSTTLAGGSVAIDASAVAVDAAVQKILALPVAERLAKANLAEREFELELGAFSGLTDAMGGADQLAAALDSTAQQRAATISAAFPATISAASLGFAAPSSGRPEATEPLIGGLFGLMLLGGLLDSIKPGKAADISAEGITAQIKDGALSLGIDVTHLDKGLESKLKATSESTICPDSDGHLEGKMHIDATASKGGLGQNITVDVTFAASVDDNGEMTPQQGDVRMQSAEYGGGKREFIDVQGGIALGHMTNMRVNRSGGTANAHSADVAGAIGAISGLLAWVQMYSAADKSVKDGRCVELVVSASPGPTGLNPSEQSTITAQPTSRIDGLATGGTVTALLTGGAAAVDPSSTPVKADTDAQFTYTAPGEKDKTGTVSLEARSKRGIAKATIDFDTKQHSYTASYTGGGITITGSIASLSEPFTTEGTFPGGTATFLHTPTDSKSGTITISGGGSQAVVTGTGTYTIVDNGDGTLTMNEQVHSCVNVSGACNDNAQPVTLTPTS